MSHGILLSLAGILVLGILAQWTAWRLRLPSILLLLVTGILAGPVGGWLHPDELFGELLSPVVSLSVAVILYEGGLNLKFRELRNIEHVFVLLTTVGVAISWIIGAIAAYSLLGLQWQVAALLGAILVVTGPTVIGPILRHLRLRCKVGVLLKWEGIIIDPLGATLAVLTFTVAQATATGEGLASFGLSDLALSLGLTVVSGVVAGSVAAGVLVLALSRFWIPDSLHNPVSLMLMFAAFTAADMVQQESGLLAVTVMGITLANQKRVSISHVVEFKETLSVLLISCLFIVLSARLPWDDLQSLGWESLLFVAVMIFVARPLSVLASTWNSPLSWQERCFLCCMAPRGIVAAAISSVFALALVAADYPEAMRIVPVTFLLVFVTVLLYGLSAAPLAGWLGLTQPNPQGILFVGADAWVRAAASTLHREGCPVVLIDSAWENIRRTRMAGLPCLYGSALAEATREEIDYTGLGRMLAVTSNTEVNSLACLRFAEDFGRQEVYQLPFSYAKDGRHELVPQKHRGRWLFREELNYADLREFAGHTPQVRNTKLTPAFDYNAFLSENGDKLLPLFILKADRSIQICTVKAFRNPKPGDRVVSLVRESHDLPVEQLARATPSSVQATEVAPAASDGSS